MTRTPAGAGCDAGAFEAVVHDPVTIACDVDGSRTFTVGNEVDLNAAIDCFNSGVPGAGSYVVLLANDIALETRVGGDEAALALIDQASPDLDLTIDGMANKLLVVEGPGLPAGGGSFRHLMAIASTNEAPVAIADIEMASADSGVDTLLSTDAGSPLTVTDSAFSPTGGFAIVSEAAMQVTIHNSFFIGPFGIIVDAGELAVSNSTFLHDDAFGRQVAIAIGANSRVDVTTSTFQNSIISIGDPVVGTIAHSTFVDAQISGTDLSGIAASSNILDACPATLIDDGNNVGTCLGDTIPLPSAEDNGCVVPTPIGCPPTVALPADSPAVGQGRCVDVTADQRGEPRTPVGLGCDAGAYELADFDPTTGLAGDVDDTGTVDHADVLALLDHLAGNGTPPLIARGDLTNDDNIALDDALAAAQVIE